MQQSCQMLWNLEQNGEEHWVLTTDPQTLGKMDVAPHCQAWQWGCPEMPIQGFCTCWRPRGTEDHGRRGLSSETQPDTRKHGSRKWRRTQGKTQFLSISSPEVRWDKENKGNRIFQIINLLNTHKKCDDIYSQVKKIIDVVRGYRRQYTLFKFLTSSSTSLPLQTVFWQESEMNNDKKESPHKSALKWERK